MHNFCLLSFIALPYLRLLAVLPFLFRLSLAPTLLCTFSRGLPPQMFTTSFLLLWDPVLLPLPFFLPFLCNFSVGTSADIWLHPLVVCLCWAHFFEVFWAPKTSRRYPPPLLALFCAPERPRRGLTCKPIGTSLASTPLFVCPTSSFSFPTHYLFRT